MPRLTQSKLPKPTQADYRSLSQYIAQHSGTELLYTKSGTMTVFSRGWLTGSLADPSEPVTLKPFKTLAEDLTKNLQVDLNRCALYFRLQREEGKGKSIGWINPMIRGSLLAAMDVLNGELQGVCEAPKSGAPIDAYLESLEPEIEVSVEEYLEDLNEEYDGTATPGQIDRYDDAEIEVVIELPLTDHDTETLVPIADIVEDDQEGPDVEDLDEPNPIAWTGIPKSFTPSQFTPLKKLLLDPLFDRLTPKDLDWVDLFAGYLGVSEMFSCPIDHLPGIGVIMGLPADIEVADLVIKLDNYFEAFGLEKSVVVDDEVIWDQNAIETYLSMGDLEGDDLEMYRNLFDDIYQYYVTIKKNAEGHFHHGHRAVYPDSFFNCPAYFDSQGVTRHAVTHEVLMEA